MKICLNVGMFGLVKNNQSKYPIEAAIKTVSKIIQPRVTKLISMYRYIYKIWNGQHKHNIKTDSYLLL